MAPRRSERRAAGTINGRHHLAAAPIGTETNILCPEGCQLPMLVGDGAGDLDGQRILVCQRLGCRHVEPLVSPGEEADDDVSTSTGETAPGTATAPADQAAAVQDSWAATARVAREMTTAKQERAAARRSARNASPGGTDARSATGPAGSGSSPAPVSSTAPGSAAAEPTTLPTALLNPSDLNPRQRFDEAALAELAASLREVGMLQPIVVRRVLGGVWAIVAGERRWRAAKVASLPEVPVRVVDVDDAGHLKLALTENEARRDLDPIEQARAYQRLAELTGQSQAQIGSSIGRDRSTIANAVRLLELPDDVITQISAGTLSASHGKALLAHREFPKLVSKLAALAEEHGWSSKQLESGTENWAYDLRNTLANAGAMIELSSWKAEFDIQTCVKACPLKAFRRVQNSVDVCLRPDHYRELQADGKQAKEAAAKAAVEQAAAKGNGVPKLADLQYDSYVEFRHQARPSGCSTDDCPCASPALDRGGQIVQICTDPARFHELERLAKRAADKRKRERYAEQLARLEALVDGEGASDRVMAMLAARILEQIDGPALIKEAAERHAPTIASGLTTKSRKRDWDQPDGLAALEALGADVVGRFAIDALLRWQLKQIFESTYVWEEAGRLARWLLGLDKEGNPLDPAPPAVAETMTVELVDPWPHGTEVIAHLEGFRLRAIYLAIRDHGDGPVLGVDLQSSFAGGPPCGMHWLAPELVSLPESGSDAALAVEPAAVAP